MEQPAAQAAAAQAAKRARPAAAGRSRGALRPAHERRGAQARPEGHGLPHAARPRRARGALLGARRAQAGADRHGARRSSAALAGRQHGRDPRPPPADQQHAARRLCGPRRRQDRPHRRGGLEPRRERRSRRRCGSTRSCSARPTRRHRDRDVARLLDWGFDRYKRARAGAAPGSRSASAGTVRVVAANGLAATLDPGEQVQRRVVLPQPSRSPRPRAASGSATSSCAAARGVLGRVPLVADRAGGGHPGRSCRGCARIGLP